MDSSEVAKRLQALEKKRRDRKAAQASAAESQRLEDLEAVDALEERLGDINVVVVEIDAGPGYPTVVVGRVPTQAEYSCYRDGCKTTVTKRGATVSGARVASSELGRSCFEYPIGDDRSRLLAHRPALLEALGAACAQRAAAQKDEEGNE